MSNREWSQQLRAESVSSPADKAERLRRFIGPIAERDREVVDYWRDAGPGEHARAMIELAEYAETMVAQTGLAKDSTEMFPGFSSNRFNAA